MKAYSLALAAFAVLLSLLLSTVLNRAQAVGRPLPRPPFSSASNKAPTSQAFTDLQAERKKPPNRKQVDSSFRRIPPSTSNPTQNKCTPPLDGQRERNAGDSKFP